MDISDLIEKISAMLFTPEVFWHFLAGLAGVAFLVFLIHIIFSKIRKKRLESEKKRTQQYWEGQLKECSGKNKEFSKTIELLKAQIENKEKEIASYLRLKEELGRKEDALRQETLAKERISGQLKDTESALVGLKQRLETSQKEMARVGVLEEELSAKKQELSNKGEELSRKEDELKKEISKKEELTLALRNAESKLRSIQEEFKSSQEVYNGLKEQCADLELQMDALNQAFALEKSLHSRLKEEHSRCPVLRPSNDNPARQ
jgi:chromosome segregation ATPase